MSAKFFDDFARAANHVKYPASPAAQPGYARGLIEGLGAYAEDIVRAKELEEAGVFVQHSIGAQRTKIAAALKDISDVYAAVSASRAPSFDYKTRLQKAAVALSLNMKDFYNVPQPGLTTIAAAEFLTSV